LCGQYDRLLAKTLAQVERKPVAKILQFTCVYGKLTPSLFASTDNEVHVCDVATDQLNLARRKVMHVVGRCHFSRMNAECLVYCNDAFDKVIVFFSISRIAD